MNAVNIGAFSSIRNKKDKNLTQSVRISDARMNSSTTQGSPQLQDDLDAQVRRVTQRDASLTNRPHTQCAPFHNVVNRAKMRTVSRYGQFDETQRFTPMMQEPSGNPLAVDGKSYSTMRHGSDPSRAHQNVDVGFCTLPSPSPGITPSDLDLDHQLVSKLGNQLGLNGTMAILAVRERQGRGGSRNIKTGSSLLNPRVKMSTQMSNRSGRASDLHKFTRIEQDALMHHIGKLPHTFKEIRAVSPSTEHR